jgi:predicted NAD/FAD-binding protein
LKIAVIGAGVAGLTSAWLLDQDHEVTLFEKEERLGGHALTVHFEINGRRVFANPAAGYITPSIYPYFLRLLQIMHVKLISIPASVTVYSRPLGRAAMLTPRLSLRRLAKLIHPKMLAPLLEFQRTLRAARQLDREDDWHTTLEEFLEQASVSQFVRDEIIYPWTAAISETTSSDIKGFSARAALKYPVHGQSGGISQAFRLQELDGGIASYIKPLLDTLRTTRVLAETSIRSIQKQNGQWTLTDSKGNSHDFEHVVMASPAYETKRIIDTLAGASDLQRILGGFPYTPARIAVHNDKRFMPPDRIDWSMYNTINSGKDCEATIWCPGPDGTSYFKSWVTFSEQLPQPLYSVHHFHHPMMTPAYYRAQFELKKYNGEDNLWFTGSYTQDIDSHESGICSAIDVAKKLNPNSANLRSLLL